MVKRSLFWGQAAGKLGEAVFYRAGGEQRTRTYIKTVKNPRSYLQAVNRAKLNNLTAVYKGMAPLIKSFFNPETTAQSPFNAFVKQNSHLSSYVANKAMVDLAEGAANNFYVANGSLPIDTSLSMGAAAKGSTTAAAIPALVMDTQKYNLDDAIGESTSTAFLVRGRDVYAALVGSTNPYSLPEEFDFSWTVMQLGAEAFQFYVFTIHCSANGEDTVKVVSQPSNSAPLTADELAHLLAVSGGTVAVQEGQHFGTVTGATGIAIMKAGGNLEDNTKYGAAAVVSYQAAGGKQFTKAMLTLDTAAAQEVNKYLPTGEFGSTIVAQYYTPSALIGG